MTNQDSPAALTHRSSSRECGQRKSFGTIVLGRTAYIGLFSLLIGLFSLLIGLFSLLIGLFSLLIGMTGGGAGILLIGSAGMLSMGGIAPIFPMLGIALQARPRPARRRR